MAHIKLFVYNDNTLASGLEKLGEARFFVLAIGRCPNG